MTKAQLLKRGERLSRLADEVESMAADAGAAGLGLASQDLQKVRNLLNGAAHYHLDAAARKSAQLGA